MANAPIVQDIVLNVRDSGLNKEISSLEKLDALLNAVARNEKSLGALNKALMGTFEGLDKVFQNDSIQLSVLSDKYKQLLTTMSQTKGISLFAGGTATKEGVGLFNTLWAAQLAEEALGRNALTASGGLEVLSASTAKSTTNFFRLRAIMYTVIAGFALLSTIIGKWFSVSSDYAETNHMLYATLVNAYSDTAEAQNELAAGQTSLIETIDMYGNKIKQSSDGSGKFAKVANSTADSVESFAGSLYDLATSRGLNPTSFNKVAATFFEMGNAAGLTQPNLEKLSKGMTQLTYDVASLYDKPFEEVAANMRSAISGISTAVKQYGIDISRTAANQWLLNNGIDATYNELDRASKMMVMYSIMMEDASTSQDDLAKSAMQPANQLRILKEQALMAAQALGTTLFPVVTPLIAIFITMARAIQVAAQALGTFLAFIGGKAYTDSAAQWTDFLQNLSVGGAGVSDLAGDMDDVAGSTGSAASAAKELKKELLGFDEINNITPQTESGGGGGGGGGGGASIGDFEFPDPYKWLGNVIDQLDTELNKVIVGGLEAAFKIAWGVKFVKEAKAAFKAIEFVNVPLPRGIRVLGDAISEVFRTVKFDFSTLFNISEITEAFSMLSELFHSLKLPPIFETIKALFENIKLTLGGIVEAISNVFKGLSEGEQALGVFEGLAKGISKVGKVAPVLGAVFGAFDVLTKIPGYMTAIEEGAMNMGQVIADALMTFTGLDFLAELTDKLANPENYNIDLSAVFASIKDNVISFLGTLLTTILSIIANLPSALLNLVGELLPVLGEIGGLLLQALLTLIGELIKSIIEFITHPDQWIEVGGQIIEGIKQGLGTFLEGIGEFFYNLFVVPIKNLLGISSPSTVFAEIGGFVIEGLLNGLQEMFPNVFETFSSALEHITGFFSSFGVIRSSSAGNPKKG